MRLRPLRQLALASIALVCACRAGPPSQLADAPDRVLAPLDARGQAMLTFVLDSQILQHQNPRFVGGWPIRSAMQGLPLLEPAESDLFLPLQIGLALHRIGRLADIGDLSATDAPLDGMMKAYLDDVTAQQEPSGSLAYWAVVQDSLW